jgi:hypothetical protein
MKLSRLALALLPALAACSSGSSSTTSGTSTDSLVTNAVLQSQTTHSTTVGCFSDFQACIDKAASDADVAACQAALVSCLPPPASVGADGVPDLCNPPAHGPGDGHACGGDGGMAPPPGAPDGGVPPPGGPGGGPGGGPAGGPGPGAGPGGDGRGDGPGPRVPVSPAGRIALATCHAELEKCLGAGTDAATCTATAHTCVHDALVADFKLLCDAVATQCASCPTTRPCVDLTARCAAGLTFPDQAP